MATKPMSVALATRIATYVQACPLVAGLHAGPHGSMFTETGAGRLIGVRVAPSMVVVGVVGRTRASISVVVEQVRAAVLTCAPAAAVSVTVAAMHDADTDRPAHPPCSSGYRSAHAGCGRVLTGPGRTPRAV